jgi:hypothetical protein
VEAYRQALTVYTRDVSPQSWATTQSSLGTALARLGAIQGGETGSRRLTEAVAAFRQALTVQTHDVLPRQWGMTQRNLGLALQLQIGIAGFPKGLEQVDQLRQAEGTRDDPVAQAALRALAVVGLVATNRDAEAGRQLASLIALIERQPDDFRLVWDWGQLRSLITRSEAVGVQAHRQALLGILEAVSRDKRHAILNGLKEVEGAFLGQSKNPKKAPRE